MAFIFDGVGAVWEREMPYSIEGYLARAEECVRLANLTKDDMIQRKLLELRQTYLKIVDALRRPEGGKAAD